MADTIGQLDLLGFTLWTRPEAGMFVWARLPDGLSLSSSDVAIRALERGLVLAPGNVFSLSQTADRYLRFNVAQCGDKRVFDGLAMAIQP
jgi:DNA-binding transcriptional MocR family regulator